MISKPNFYIKVNDFDFLKRTNVLPKTKAHKVFMFFGESGIYLHRLLLLDTIAHVGYLKIAFKKLATKPIRQKISAWVYAIHW